MARRTGTVSRGIRCPIIREGDDIAAIVVDSVIEAAREEGFELRDKDVVAVTESVVARSQGNYASVEAIAADVKAKLGGETVGVIFPILSRNRFAICLRGIAMGAKKIVLMLNYPSDEVGNHLVSLDQLDEAGINPYTDVLTEAKYRELFGINPHPFTKVDYIQYYGDLIRSCGAEVEIILANDPKVILNYTDSVLCCDIHSRARTKRILKAAGAKTVVGLDEILNAPKKTEEVAAEVVAEEAVVAVAELYIFYKRKAQSHVLRVPGSHLVDTAAYEQSFISTDKDRTEIIGTGKGYAHGCAAFICKVF